MGFNVNARSRTAPLHEAAMRGNLPVIRLLLEHGADPNLRDTGRLTLASTGPTPRRDRDTPTAWPAVSSTFTF